MKDKNFWTKWIFTTDAGMFILASTTMRLMLAYMWDLDFSSDMKNFIAFCYGSIIATIYSSKEDKE